MSWSSHVTSLLRPSLVGLAGAMLAFAPRSISMQAAPPLWGDVSADGIVDAGDAQAILSGSVSLPIPSGFKLNFGDANCDGTIGALDAQIVLSKAVGLTVAQYCVGAAAKALITGEIRDVISFGPIAGAKIVLQTAGAGAGVALPREALTDAGGLYTIYNNVPDGTYTLAVSGASFQGASGSSVVVKANSPQKVDATLTPSTSTAKYASLSGRILTPAGAGASGAAVQLSGGVQTNGVFKATTTASDGTYSFSGVSLVDQSKIAIASFTVIARGTGGETGSKTAVVLAANEIRTNVDVAMSAATSSTTFFTETFDSTIPSAWVKTGLWNHRGTSAITNSAYPVYVKLAPNDASAAAVPLPMTGAGAAWAGSATTGNFIGTQVAGDVALSGGKSTTSSSSLLTSPSFLVPSNATRATLAFDSWFEIESVNPNASGYDIMEITATDVGTNVTTSLTRLNPFEDPAASDRNAIPFTSGGFNRMPVWRPVYINLDSYKGRNIKLGFCFRTVDNLFNGFRGWLIDNVRVTDEVGAGAMAGAMAGVGSLASGQPARSTAAANEAAGTATSCAGTVQTVAVSSVTVAPTPVTIAAQTTAQLLATPKDANGVGLAGKTVSWSSSNNAVATVNSSGLVSGVAGGTVTITATVESKTGTASVTVIGVPNTLSINAGNSQSATVGNAVTTPPSVKVVNSSGQAVAGVAVTFAVASGGGSINGGTPTTNSSGIATVGSWTLGPAAGANTLTATASGLTGSPVTFTATGVAAGLNLTIDGLYVTQATQTLARDVPLVANRPALIRVFATATESNSAQPSVRVRLYRNGEVTRTYTIAAPAAGVTTAVNEGTLSLSWNVAVAAADMQTGLSILADVDPSGTVTETIETDNSYPVSGTPLVLDVRAVPTFNVTFVPITQPGNITGDVTESNMEQYMDYAKRVYPLADYNTILHLPFSYGTTVPSTYATVWGDLLLQIRALRIAELPAPGTSRFYYGVLHPTYTSGGTGFGYLGDPAAIGVDWTGTVAGSSTDYRSMTAAHEWGHNFNRNHIACGGPSNPDTAYPHNPETIGAFGYDVFRNALLPQATTKDLMTYCTPLWISDYTYKAVLTYRGTAAAASLAAAGSAPGRGLLVWGEITPQGITLQPAFEVNAAPSLPRRAGPASVQAMDDAGRVIFDLSFDADQIDHLPGVRQFAYVVPLPASGASPSSIRLRANGRETTLRSAIPQAAAGAGAAQARVSALSGLRSRLEWNAALHPMVMVRDVATGQILSFARGGSSEVVTPRPDVEIVFSDGVKSTRQTLRVTPR